MIENFQLEHLLNELLEPHFYRDYCPNGLQVEGRSSIRKVVTGVTASQALIDAAVAEKADALLVHHGYFWKGEAAPLVGIKQRRLKTLLAHDINLFAYHLPLDGHSLLGNNAQLAKLLGLEALGGLDPAEKKPIAMLGELRESASAAQLTQRIKQALGREPFVCSDSGPAVIKRIAWCTGGGQSYIEQAARAGCDAFISGEVSEQTVHIAREGGSTFSLRGTMPPSVMA